MISKGAKDAIVDALLPQLGEQIVFHVGISRQPKGGFAAFVEELPGCMTQADTEDELHQRLQEAITGYMKCLLRQVIEEDEEFHHVVEAIAAAYHQKVEAARQEARRTPVGFPPSKDVQLRHEEYYLPVRA